MTGKIIAIEGIDGSGKNTQAKLLVDNLRKQGFDVEFMSFPCYEETMFGKEIGAYLNGDFGSLDEVHPKLAALLYAGDRLEKKAFIKETIAQGKILVIDRYVSSNIVHQGARVSAGADRENFCQWLSHLEHTVYGLPHLDLNILLNIDVATSTRLVLNKDDREYTNKKKDLHEADGNYMQKVAKVYRLLSKDSTWQQVECVEDQKLRSISKISKDILDVVMAHLNLDGVHKVNGTVYQARQYAVLMHRKQKYGYVPYVHHLDEVARLVAEFSVEDQILAYLHDVMEDTIATYDDIENLFGERMVVMLKLITDEEGINRKERKRLSYDKLAGLSPYNEDHATVLRVKLADRLCNVINSRKDARVGNSSKLKMYRDEHAAFRNAVYRDDFCVPMQQELDRLLDNKNTLHE